MNTHTITCHYCRKENQIDVELYKDSHLLDFCGIECLHKFHNDGEIKKKALCLICNKEFEHRGADLFCSDICNKQYIDELQKTSLFPLGSVKQCKIVPKTWGNEVHLINNSHYCAKYLNFYEGQKFSFHAHHLKREVFMCVQNKFECILSKNGEEEKFIINQGDKIEIEPGVLHQVKAIGGPSTLLEISTIDFPEDSYRFETKL